MSRRPIGDHVGNFSRPNGLACDLFDIFESSKRPGFIAQNPGQRPEKRLWRKWRSSREFGAQSA
jgi:hypothetical protein